MTKRLMVKVGEYQKDGQTKGEYVKLGVILSGANGEYVLLDPTVNIAGCLAKQNVMAVSKGEQQRDSVMCSIFDDSQQQGQAPQQGYQQQPQQAPQGYQQQPHGGPQF